MNIPICRSVLARSDLTCNARHVASDLTDDDPNGEGGRLSRSRNALRDLHDEVIAVCDEYPISMVGLDELAGVVVVGLSRDDADVRAEIGRRFGGRVRVEPGTRRYRAV